MTQITKEAIEAGLRITLSSVNMPAGECLHETDVREILEAALPFLRIAGGSRVKALEWREEPIPPAWESLASTGVGLYCIPHGRDRFYLRFRDTIVLGDFPTLGDAKAAAQTDYETRILSALTSSPGKDGGPEVEAVALYQVELEDGTIDHISGVFGMPVQINGIPVSKVTPLYARPQPASTALVERLTKALEPFANARIPCEDTISGWRFGVNPEPADYHRAYDVFKEARSYQGRDEFRKKARAIMAGDDRGAEVVSTPNAARDVLDERDRQKAVEGWTPAHDDGHTDNELARAAACYAIGNIAYWPWSLDWWKPTDRRRNLVKAGALILAEIERLDRSAHSTGRDNAE